MELHETTQRIEGSNLPQPVKDAGRELAAWLAKLPANEGCFLPLSHVSERFSETLEYEHLLAALTVLSRSEFAVLEVSGYIDDDDEGPIVLTPDEYQEAMRSGVLVHPDSGDDLGDPAKYLHLYFLLRSQSSA